MSQKRFELLLVVFFFIFSWWLMDKSFGYDAMSHTFRIARHQIGDFGLHLSLIRSFSWGDNFPPELPFYPGQSLPYHYYFDLFVGLLEKIGLPLNLALNGLSMISFTFLLWLIYKLSQVVFGENKLIGIVSVALFIFHSNLTFLDFAKETSITSLFYDLWYLPDYINKGPFDGSIISIFFTLNVYLNQRHLIAALAISLALLYFLLTKLMKSRSISIKSLVLIGIILGLSSRLHTLVFFSSLSIILLLFLLFRRFKLIFPLIIPTLLIFSFHWTDIVSQQPHPFINPGFLAEKPITIDSFFSFWFMNLGVALFLIPLGFFLADKKQKMFFLSFLPLFILGNILQASFRIEHNHSLFNYFIILANFYIAFVLIKLWRGKALGKIVVLVLAFLLTMSGFIDLFAIKNDYQYRLKDAPGNKLMEWIKNNTGKNDIFLARQEILDPVTLSGRRNYFGHSYYLSVMGYDFLGRERQVREFFEADTHEALVVMRKEGIEYMVVPAREIPDFHYKIDTPFLRENLRVAYEDKDVLVFQL